METGLAEFIEGRQSLESSAWRAATRDDGLVDVVSAGTPSGNPADVIAHPRFNGLVKEAPQAYDVVVVELPPVATCGDALSLTAPMGGSIVALVKKGDRRSKLSAAARDLSAAGIATIAVVLFGVRGVDSNGPVAQTERAASTPLTAVRSSTVGGS
jgi:tyrosine-protein kinase Etk/Wzc